MKLSRVALLFVIAAQLLVSGCSSKHEPHGKIEPAHVDHSYSDKSTPAEITLRSEARARLGIVSQAFPSSAGNYRTLRASSLLYDAHGGPWVYVEPTPSHFHRERVSVISASMNEIRVIASFDTNIPVVTVGAAELFGTELGVGH